MKNNYLYQGAYSELDDDIGWTDFALRNYDAQIGRWVQPDPYQEFASPYVGMGDDPINLSDPSGGSILDGLGGVARVAATTIGGAIIGTIFSLASGDDDFTGTLIGAGAGLAAGLGSLINQITLSMGIQTAKLAVNVINSSFKVEGIGIQLSQSNTIRTVEIAYGPNASLKEFPEANDEVESGSICIPCVVWGAYRAYRLYKLLTSLKSAKVPPATVPSLEELQKQIAERLKEAAETLEKVNRELAEQKRKVAEKRAEAERVAKQIANQAKKKHTTTKSKSKNDKHTKVRPGERTGTNRNNQRGEKNKKFTPKTNPNKYSNN